MDILEITQKKIDDPKKLLSLFMFSNNIYSAETRVFFIIQLKNKSTKT